ncbi:MAG: aspartate ammonia-lyase, partial [Thermostichales cyanobacterium SRBZ-1_bins_19]
ACDEILAGSLRDQFVVDIYQAGAGTSHHMNVNEVLANRALEILGLGKGCYERLSPNDHVNYGQSTNDVIPTAIRLGAALTLEQVLSGLDQVVAALEEKATAFQGIIRSGRTHLQDAVPVRLGENLRAYAVIFRQHQLWVGQARHSLYGLGLGGSAAGTGINTHPDYVPRVIQHLQTLTGLPLHPAPHPMAAMQSMAPFVQVSGSLRNLAQDGIKLANDLRLLDSGPATGLKEIALPPVQPGSSIMPGKYNPVMAEMLNMVCFQVLGLDTAITYAAQAGQLELNVMMPLIAFDLLHSIQILGQGLQVFAQRCLAGITANPERCRYFAESSLALVTALNPHIGYLAAAEVAKESLHSGRPIPEVVLAKKLLTPEQLAAILDLEAMSQIQWPPSGESND